MPLRSAKTVARRHRRYRSTAQPSIQTGCVATLSGAAIKMNSAPRPVDLTQVPAVPWAWVDEHVYAAIRGCSVKVLQNERRLNIGCPFRRINGTMIRYKIGDITAFLESQPGGGGASKPMNPPSRRRGRPRKSLT